MPLLKTTLRTSGRILATRRVPGARQQPGPKMAAKATRELRQVVGGGSVLSRMGTSGEDAHLATLQALETTDHTHGRGSGKASPTVSLEVEKEAIAAVAGGASPMVVESEYQLARGYVDRALSRRYGSPEAGKLALRGLLLENAIACNMHAQVRIDEMTAPQAVMSGAILTDKVIAIEKTLADKPKTIDFGQLADMGRTLKVLKEIVQNPKAATQVKALRA